VKLCAHSRTGFPIATKWCCDEDVNVVPLPVTTITRRSTIDRCSLFVVKWRLLCGCNLSVDIALIMCDSAQTGYARRITPGQCVA